MCQLLETIKVFRNVLQNIEYHAARVNRSRNLLLGASDTWDLSKMITIPELDPDQIYRCRFLYGKEPGKTQFIPYVRREIRKLYLADCGSLDYSFKYANRLELENLKHPIPDPDFADILIVKDGRITDTSFANVVFTDGEKCYTPASPLLRGTKRQFYLDHEIIHEREIGISDLHKYQNVRLINALIDLEDSGDIPVKHIAQLPGNLSARAVI
jgi:4-amino-4-deoxychorismate lyase